MINNKLKDIVDTGVAILVGFIAIIILIIFLNIVIKNLEVESVATENTSRMQLVEKVEVGNQVYGYILYDTQTKVMYLFNYNGGIIVMIDNEGQPLLYREEVN